MLLLAVPTLPRKSHRRVSDTFSVVPAPSWHLHGMLLLPLHYTCWIIVRTQARSVQLFRVSYAVLFLLPLFFPLPFLEIRLRPPNTRDMENIALVGSLFYLIIHVPRALTGIRARQC